MKWDNVDIGDFSNLLVRVVTIGYQRKGESCIFLLIDKRDNSIIYSFVIDSYRRQKRNHTIHLLNQYGVGHLDLLCWSHPDDDHSLGIDEILSNHCNDDTKILTPISFWSHDYTMKALNANKREQAFVEHFLEINRRTKRSLHTVSAGSGGKNFIFQINFIAGLDKIEFSIWVMSPITERLKGMIDNGEEITRNQTSVSLLVKIGPYAMFFSSDIPDSEIEFLNEDEIKDVVFLKIPHHGSRYSGRIIDYLPPHANFLGCSTVYRSTRPGSELPHKDIITRYLSKSDQIYITGSDMRHNHGMVVADYDLFGTHQCSVSLDGSAFKA